MKNMLKRMKQIQQTVSEHLERDPKDAQHTNGCPKCDSAQHQKTRCASPTTITSGKQATKSPKARNTKQAAPSTPRKQDNGSFVSVNSNDSQRLSETESSKWQKVGQRSKQAKKHNCRPDAVMIRCKEKDSYAQVLKVVHSGAAIQEFKNKVSGIRRTAAGEILLRMTKASDECTGKLQKAIQEAIGKQAEVKAIADKVTLEIRDIAEWTTSEEVLEAVFKAIDCDLSSEATPKLRPAYQGTQTATLILPRDIADQILKLGKMRIGWAVCRLRAKVEPRRCFKCLNFGHIASRCRTQDLLAKIVEERNIDVAILSDTYTAKHDGTWHQSNDGGAAIWSCGQNPVQLTHRLQHRWFVRAKAKDVFIYSCYLPPRVQIEEFKAALDDVVEDALGKSPILIAGDFNAWCTDWGSKRNNQRGLILADTLAHLNVCLLNNGSQSTYSMAGRESIIDLTFVSPELARDAAWQVSDINTHSDHNAVLTELRAGTATRRMQPARHVGYKVSTLNRAILLANVQTISATGDANSCAQKIADCIKTACEASMAKRYSGGSRRNPVPWWNGEISKARAECCAAKRRLQRSRGRSSFESNLMEFRTKRKILRNAITDSKKRCFQELCAAADAEPFGAAYKMVMGKLNKQPMPTCEKTLDTIVRHLFPQQPPLCALVHLPGITNAVAETTASEVLDIAANIKPGNSPGPDGIPNSVLKTIIAAHPNVPSGTHDTLQVEETKACAYT
ncbi:hypothetical protein ACLKA7_004892 [Drosophila subpalustris]